jgi:pimeloyl-ACP methyl ester carboxylesterase
MGRLTFLYDPFSAAVMPLADGLARRWLLTHGLSQQFLHHGPIELSYYHQPAQTPGNLPLLLVHGIGDSSMTWALTMPLLAHRHELFALDLPGHGYTNLPFGRSYVTLDEHLDELEVFARQAIKRPFVVVGNSLGGLLAVRLANRVRDLVAGAVLLDPGGAPLGRPIWDAFFNKLRDTSLFGAYRTSQELIGVVPGPALALTTRSVQRMLQRPVILQAYEHSGDEVFLSAAELMSLSVPTGLIWGLRDRFLPPGSREFFQAQLPGARTLFMNRCGHLPQRERPLAVNRFVQRFARDVQRARESRL